MSQDPLALAGFTSAARHEAEYDAVYAAVTATERGRWFLSEFANRHRAANTDLVVAALERIEAAIGGLAARSDTPLHPEITIANGANSADAADTVPIAKIIDAAERIADTSFRLREGSVDASLCDDIEGAAREIYEVCGIGPSNFGTPNFAPSAAEEVPTDEARPAIVAPGGQIPPATIVASGTLDAVRPAMDDGAGFQSPDASAADDTPRWHIEGPDFLFQSAAEEPDQESIEPARRPERQHALLPQTLFQPGPKDDPADLFAAAGSTVAVSAVAAPQANDEAFAQVPVPTEPPVQSPQAALRVVTSAVVRPLPRPVSNDPRGTIRDLSEEELIALFG
ncbi:MAG TPA: hypothetical protein VGH13_09955 [Xanthobacteraceae bacterium]